MSDLIIAAAATILVCIQAHRNYLMMQSKEDRTADILEKLLKHLENQEEIKERNRLIERRYYRGSGYR